MTEHLHLTTSKQAREIGRRYATSGATEQQVLDALQGRLDRAMMVEALRAFRNAKQRQEPGTCRRSN
jgi:hypothetical protein